VVDIKPNNMEELTEVITAAKFHPEHCNMLAYSTSRGMIKIVDTRASALCDSCSRVFEEPEDPNDRTFFTEIIASVSDFSFGDRGRYIVSRDYLSLKIWDLYMESKPVKVINIHNHLNNLLCELYEADQLFDKFRVAASPNFNYILSGGYG
jgi:serine/threonine-protein phosphatase 2A regulatory subunit B